MTARPARSRARFSSWRWASSWPRLPSTRCHNFRVRPVPAIGALLTLAAAGVLTQPSAARLATNAEALVASPVFFHGKQIAVRRDVEPAGRLTRLTGTARPVFVFLRERPSVT